jgi:K(+)-stimulated pyrophosphate-energized sodium pump
MIVPALAVNFPLSAGIWIALICALCGLGAAIYLIKMIVGYSPGNEKMRQIAGAIQEGAKAYLNRQILSVSVIAVIIFFILGFTRDFFTAFGFLIGAACSMAAGYTGMRIAVISNSRAAQAATDSGSAALRVERQLERHLDARDQGHGGEERREQQPEHRQQDLVGEVDLQ